MKIIKNNRNPYENHANLGNHIIQRDNYENNENHRILLEN